MFFYGMLLRNASKIVVFENVIFFWTKIKKNERFWVILLLILGQEDHCMIVNFRPPFFGVSFLDLFSN